VPIEECFAEFLKSGSSDKDVWINFLNRHKGLIYYNQDLRKLQIHAVRPTTEVELSHRPTDSRGSPKEIKLSAKEHRNSKEVPYLSSGGWLNIITLRWGVAGHSDVTEYVLREYFKFFPGARDIVSDASQDPDFYDWKTDRAHAQTPMNLQTGEILRQDDIVGGKLALDEFIEWLSTLVARVKTECHANRPKDALYLMGYALHGVQDLAAHNGRLASEHSWNSYCHSSSCGGKISEQIDPDDNVDNIKLAYDYSETFLSLINNFVGDDCWRKMKTHQGHTLSKAEKQSLIPKTTGWDLTWEEYQLYKGFASKFALLANIEKNTVRWVDPTDKLSNVSRILLSKLNHD
jgi:hypothetical protein